MSADRNARVAIVDAGGANLGSVRYALERLGVEPHVTKVASEIAGATHVILPGVGAAAAGMLRLREAGLVDCLRELTQPVLGICLGMQLLFEHSEEGEVEMLGILEARVRALRPMPGVRIPHMGWNRVRQTRASALFEGVPQDGRAYFVHAFAADAEGTATVAETTHGHAFSAAVVHRNFHGVQFHPERSAQFGAQVLSNFLALPA